MSSAVQSRKIALPRALTHGAKREKVGSPESKTCLPWFYSKKTSSHSCGIVVGKVLLLLFNTTRTTSGPPSTGAAIAMDGGVADLCCGFCSTQRARARAWSGPPSRSTSARIKCEVGPRCGRSFSCARDGAHDFGNNSLFRHLSRTDRQHVRCLVPTLENVPQLARVVRCVVRVLYTL